MSLYNPPIKQFYDDFIDEIWKPGYIYSKKDDEMKAAGRGRTIRVEDLTHLQLAQYLTDYIVIGPISTDLQRATGQLLCTYVAAIIARIILREKNLSIHIYTVELLWIACQAIQTVVCS